MHCRDVVKTVDNLHRALLVVVILLVGLYEIGHLLQDGRNVVVLDNDALREVERSRCEVQHTLNAGINNRHDQLACCFCWQGDDYDAYVVVRHNILELGHMVARNIVYRMADLLRVDIECRRDAEFQLLAVEVFSNRLTEVTHTDYGDIHIVLAVKYIVDKVNQHLYVVPLFCVAREADEHQITTYLHRRNAVNAGQDVRKYVGDTLPMARE